MRPAWPAKWRKLPATTTMRPSADRARDRAGASGWASQSSRAPVFRSIAARYGRWTMGVGSWRALLVLAPGGMTPVNSPAKNTRSPASAMATTFPARSDVLEAGSSEGPVPHVGLGWEENAVGDGSAAPAARVGRIDAASAVAAAKTLTLPRNGRPPPSW